MTLIVCLSAFGVALLTFFSGFGLGTLLLPIFMLFFPVPVAIAVTAVIHLVNNLFKTVLLARYARLKILALFGLPALAAAVAGAKTLALFSGLPELYRYQLFHRSFVISPIKMLVAILIIVFVLLESGPVLKRWTLGPKWLPLGGLLSGFFGGLSGHQGALRMVFLMRCGLSKEGLLATGVLIACAVDISRLWVYQAFWGESLLLVDKRLILSAILSALAGSAVGNRFLRKMSLERIHGFVSLFLTVLAIALGLGIF